MTKAGRATDRDINLRSAINAKRTMINSARDIYHSRSRGGQGTFSRYHFISTRSCSRVVCINKPRSETGNEREPCVVSESGPRSDRSDSIRLDAFYAFLLIKFAKGDGALSNAIHSSPSGQGYERDRAPGLMDNARRPVIPAALNEPCNRAHETRTRNPPAPQSRGFSATTKKP